MHQVNMLPGTVVVLACKNCTVNDLSDLYAFSRLCHRLERQLNLELAKHISTASELFRICFGHCTDN